MKKFAGFPTRIGHTPIPSTFFHAILPCINDMAELRATLLFFWRLSHKRSYPKFVTLREMTADHNLLGGGWGKDAESPQDALRRGLAMASERGTMIHLVARGASRTEDLYFLNTDEAKRGIAQLHKDGFNWERATEEEAPLTAKRPNILALYEDNVGLVTPLLADLLSEAEKTYPYRWIEEAFREAVSANKRNWRYISRILERWAREGRDGQSGRDSGTYLQGPFGRLIRH